MIKFTSNAKFPQTKSPNLDEYSGFIGWYKMFENINWDLIADIEKTAAVIRKCSDVLIVIGTGGSTQGSRAVIELLAPKSRVMFLGEHLNAFDIKNALEIIKQNDVCINFISKSGTTLEPNIAFNILHEAMQKKYGKDEIKQRIIFTTGAKPSGYKTYSVPGDIGGRYSVFTTVGLLPIAAAGIDIRELLAGAAESFARDESACLEYARHRHGFAGKYSTDIFGFFHPRTRSLGAWLCQLFGESEGKDGRGLYPTVNVYPQDLHSVGQFVQEGRKCFTETLIHFAEAETDIACPGMAFTINEVNNKMYRAVIGAHTNGEVPVMTVESDRLSTRNVGELLFFFMRSCALYCMMQGVHPFNQPSVEMYKNKLKESLQNS